MNPSSLLALTASEFYSSDYSSSENSDSDSEDCEPDNDKKIKSIALTTSNKRAQAKKYENYCGYDVPGMYRSMSESGYKTNSKYVLAHSENWRDMWAVSLNILGKKQYQTQLGAPSTKNKAIQRKPASDVCPDPSHVSDQSLPRLVPKNRFPHLANSPLINQGNRKIVQPSPSPAPQEQDAGEPHQQDILDEESVLSAASTRCRNNSIGRAERAKAKRIKANVQRREQQQDFIRRFQTPVDSLLVSSLMGESSKSSRRCAAPSSSVHKVSSTLRRIGAALAGISRQERSKLVGRGVVELIEPTALRTRLSLYLGLAVTSKEVKLLFKKFDPNSIGSVNLADVYGNALSITSKKKKARTRRTNSFGKIYGSGSVMEEGRRSRSRSEGEGERGVDRDIEVSTTLEERVNQLGELDGTMCCSVHLSHHRQHEQEGAEEVEDEESMCGASSSSATPSRSRDLAQTVKTEIGEESDDVEHSQDSRDTVDFDQFDQALLLSGRGENEDLMGSTLNVREFNSLDESDSVRSMNLCSINEDMQEQEGTGGSQDSAEDESVVEECLSPAGTFQSSCVLEGGDSCEIAEEIPSPTGK